MWQCNMLHMKEQDKTPEEELSEEGTANPPKKEFKVIIVKMFKYSREDWMNRVRSYMF